MNNTIAVLGAGGSGSACATAFVLDGFKVRLYTRSSKRIRQIKGRNLPYQGDLGEGSARLDKVTTSIREAVDGADIVLCSVPAFAQTDLASKMVHELSQKQLIVLAPGYCGSLEVMPILKNFTTMIAETITVPYGGRVDDHGAVAVKAPLKAAGARLRVGSFPSCRTGEAIDKIGSLFPVRSARNVLETGLLNTNSIIHPPIMLSNLAAFEKQDIHFQSIDDGVTESVQKYVQSLDHEKVDLCKKIGVEALTIEKLLNEIRMKPPAVLGERRNQLQRESKKKTDGLYSIQERFIEEDVPYGLVLISSIGKLAAFETSVIDSTIKVFSVARGKDYFSIGRTTKTLGIHEMGLKGLQKYLRYGIRTGK